MEAEGLTAGEYFPRDPVCLPRRWFWTKYNIIDFLANSQISYLCLSVLLCFFSTFGYM